MAACFEGNDWQDVVLEPSLSVATAAGEREHKLLLSYGTASPAHQERIRGVGGGAVELDRLLLSAA